MTRHQTRVRWNDSGFRAECCCGWTGPCREHANPALIDGHEHTKDPKQRENENDQRAA